MKNTRSLVLLIALTAAQSVFAGVSPSFVGTNPSVLVAGNSFNLEMLSGPCEFLSDAPDGANIDSVVGDVVTIRILATPDLACSFPVGGRTYQLPGLAQGEYRFRVFFQTFDLSSPPELIGERLVSVVSGSGSSAAPIAVPALSLSFEAILAGVMALVGALCVLKFAEGKRD